MNGKTRQGEREPRKRAQSGKGRKIKNEGGRKKERKKKEKMMKKTNEKGRDDDSDAVGNEKNDNAKREE